MELAQQRQRFYLGGQLVEVWENPHVPFQCGPAGLRGYAVRSEWVMLFNALVLAGNTESERESDILPC
jgi:hypothetical protein